MAKHIPSGIIISWLGKDDKVHTESIPLSQAIPSLKYKFTMIDARSKLLCHQLDYLGGNIKSVPIITFGLTRTMARQQVAAFCKRELQHGLLSLPMPSTQ